MANYFNNGYNNPYNYNPMYNQQQRLLQMENQMYVPQQPQVLQQNNNLIKGRPVTCLDEAKASMIDLDGSVFVFPDLSNGKIYTKQIGNDGLPMFNIYTRVLESSNLIPDKSYDNDNINLLTDKIKALEVKIELLEKVVLNYESNAANDTINASTKSNTNDATDVS